MCCPNPEIIDLSLNLSELGAVITMATREDPQMLLINLVQLVKFFYNIYGEFVAWLAAWLAACIAAWWADQQLRRVSVLSPKTQIFWNGLFKTVFLDACTQLYKPPWRSVGPSVGQLVGQSVCLLVGHWLLGVSDLWRSSLFLYADALDIVHSSLFLKIPPLPVKRLSPLKKKIVKAWVFPLFYSFFWSIFFIFLQSFYLLSLVACTRLFKPL